MFQIIFEGKESSGFFLDFNVKFEFDFSKLEYTVHIEENQTKISDLLSTMTRGDLITILFAVGRY